MIALRERTTRRGDAIPLADSAASGGAARRTRRDRGSRSRPDRRARSPAPCSSRRTCARGRASYFASGGSGIVVLDLSTSVDPRATGGSRASCARSSRTGQPVGLVTFSDTSYEMLPPGTRGEELRPLLRFFEPPEPGCRPGRPPGPGLRVPREPVVGLVPRRHAHLDRPAGRTSDGRARRDRRRDGPARQRPRRLAVRPLGRSRRRRSRYEREGIDLRVVPLFPGEDDREFFASARRARTRSSQNDELLRELAARGAADAGGRASRSSSSRSRPAAARPARSTSTSARG